MMQLSEHLVEILSNVLEPLGPLMPGETFPAFFELEMFQRALIAAILTTIVAGFYGSFLLMKNLALMGDGLAHVSFGGVAVGSWCNRTIVVCSCFQPDCSTHHPRIAGTRVADW